MRKKVDDYLNNQHPIIKWGLWFFGLEVVNYFLVKSNLIFSKIFYASLYSVAAALLSLKFWGHKLAKAELGREQNGPITITVNLKTPPSEGLSKLLGFDSPVKTTLEVLEESIHAQLMEMLEDMSEQEESIDKLTRCIAKQAMEMKPELFYLNDRKRVNESSYFNDVDRLSLVESNLMPTKLKVA